MNQRDYWLDWYEATTAAKRTILGFAIGQDVYMVHLAKLDRNWIKIERESSARGGEEKLRMSLNTKDKLILKRLAVKVGTTDEILSLVKGNKGDSWECWVARHYGIEWKKGTTTYNKAGDLRIQNEEIQVKWENATLTKISTIQKAAGLA